jgi:16S rRNA (adenine1518-N6/adenine1519-N6)-dimethyltransferase
MPFARKRFGQHFLVDPAVIERVLAYFAPGPDQHLVEIGPGRGALTAHLAGRAAMLTLVEIDRDLAAALSRRYAGRRDVRVVCADILELPLADLAGDGRVRVIGNLPYNISTPILFHLLGQLGSVEDMLLMLQKEVVDRLAAEPGHGDYGRLTIMVGRRCLVTPLFAVPAAAFEPPPRVESAMVSIAPRAEPVGGRIDEDRFALLVRNAFNQRRKTVRNALKGLVDEAAFAAAGIDPAVRPENLSIRDYAALSRPRV